MTDLPTVAEEHFARMIAQWHGSQVLFYKSGEGAKTVASTRGFDSGFSWEVDRYVERHWQEYVAAAKAIIASK